MGFTGCCMMFITASCTIYVYSTIHSVMFCYIMLCDVMLCYVMLCCVMFCYVMLRHVMLCYVMLFLHKLHRTHIYIYIYKLSQSCSSHMCWWVRLHFASQSQDWWKVNNHFVNAFDLTELMLLLESTNDYLFHGGRVS